MKTSVTRWRVFLEYSVFDWAIRRQVCSSNHCSLEPKTYTVAMNQRLQLNFESKKGYVYATEDE